jgi:hydrogenase expression/formation protein HypC
MCLAIPAKITRLSDDGMGLAEIGGVNKEVNFSLIEDPAIGDYVVVHVGFALNKLDPEEAVETLRMFAELAEMQAEEENAS